MEEYYKAESARRYFEYEIEAEIRQLQDSRTAELAKQIEAIKSETYREVTERHKAKLETLKAEEKRLRLGMEAAKVAESSGQWYPVGSIVTKWEDKSSRWARQPDYQPTKQKGIVEVYDGSQQLPGNIEHGLPSIGDLVVFFLKKDGTKGSRFEKFNGFGRKEMTHWCIDGENPTDNILTRRQNQESEK